MTKKKTAATTTDLPLRTSKITADNSTPPAFEIPPIRLSSEETRTIMRAYQNAGKPIKLYHRDGELLELGILKEVPLVSGPAKGVGVSEAWKDMKEAVARRDMRAVEKCQVALEKMIEADRSVGYILTPMGIELARGLTVRVVKVR